MNAISKSREEILYATAQSQLGFVLAARSPKGIVAILLGEDEAVLVADLHRRFPKARLVSGGAVMAETAAAVARFVEGPNTGFPYPLDLRGTPFQTAVWEELRKVPPGKTVSYTEISRRVGRLDAVRAVAGAIGANPLAVVVPCHRVIRADGSLCGYHWGVERKRELLKREGASHK